MRILATVERVPGGLMVVPLLLGATLNTLFPQVLEIGGFTTALFSDGALAVIGAYLVCVGAQMRPRQTGKALKKGAILLFGKAAVGIAIGLAVAWLLPETGLFGLVPLAIIAAMTNANGGLFVALTEEFGDETDTGALPIIILNDGPFITLVALGAAGLADVPLLALLAVVLPLALGLVLGNLDNDIRDFLAPAQRMLIPFFAFPLGAGINFSDLLEAGPPGVLLGIMTVGLTGLGCMIALRLFRERNVIAGAAEASTAGNAVATPAAVALVDQTYSAVAPIATVQVASSTVTTAFLTPLLVVMVYRWQQSRGIDAKAEGNERRPTEQETIRE